jgi:hypothetical protein
LQEEYKNQKQKDINADDKRLLVQAPLDAKAIANSGLFVLKSDHDSDIQALNKKINELSVKLGSYSQKKNEGA